MARLEIRFDLRDSSVDEVSVHDRYLAALEQVEWAEAHGFKAVTLSEHHGTVDGYLPSPIVFAAAVAARTSRIRIRLAAIVAALHDPLRLAEDTAVLDQLCGGRLELVIANGYVPSEFEMFGKDISRRVEAVVEAVDVLKAAWSGEPFEYRGRTVRVSPRPARQPRPAIFLGGSSAGAARRAAQVADAFFPSDGCHWDQFRREVMARGGEDFGEFPPVGPRFVHLSEDVDGGWEAVGDYVAIDRDSYGTWAQEAGLDTGHNKVSETVPLRCDPQYRVLTPSECLDLIDRLGPSGTFVMNPMMGGIPPALAWESIRLFESRVLTQLPT